MAENNPEFSSGKKTERIVIGILAHVDAGKTTLSEGLLYLGGSIRQMGRVDRRDTFLDTDEMERERGITIYAKQAVFSSPRCDREYTILDTPGHADFSAEMERTLSVLDAAVLLISAADGINAQVKLLWELLAHHRVPVFIFVNKMDQAEAAQEAPERRRQLMQDMQRMLSGNMVDVTGGMAAEEVQEAMALASEKESLLDAVMNGEKIPDEMLRDMIRRRQCFPVLFGSALKMQGVETLLELLDTYAAAPDYAHGEHAVQVQGRTTAGEPAQKDSLSEQDKEPGEASGQQEFSARVIKITRSASGERETLMKITGGRLAVRQSLRYRPQAAETTDEDDTDAGQGYAEEKVTQIRQYSGEKYTALPEAVPGMVCAVTGLTGTFAGQGFGCEKDAEDSLLAPVLAWQVILPPDVDVRQAYRQLQLLEEEEPMLQLSYQEQKREIRAHMMGEVQREVLIDQARKRFGWEIRFGLPSVIYKETIAAPVEGVGHFEPLRHYAEVHLLLEPGEEGSGLVFEDRCPPDTLPGQYRRQILSELAKRRHRGVLTGSAVTDLRVSLVGGKAHEKHTCGGDFRQAAYRALRQGLMMAQNVLLEPCYAFVITVPDAMLGRTLLDLQQMGASFGTPERAEEAGGYGMQSGQSRITGQAPVAAMDAWRESFTAFTKGEGRLQLHTGPYRPCKEQERIVEEAAYDPMADRYQPSDSVFCMHGAGTRIPWYLVRDYMHVEGAVPAEVKEEMDVCAAWVKHLYDDPDGGAEAAFLGGSESGAALFGEEGSGRPFPAVKKNRGGSFRQREKAFAAAEEELRAIFEKTYGPIQTDRAAETKAPRVIGTDPKPYKKARPRPEKEFLLVDGYNIIHAWEDLRVLAEQDLQAARDRLLDILSDYAGFAKPAVICVFDAYKVPGGQERVYRYHNIDVVFTREAETADQYIEKTAHELSGKYGVSVATSDGLEQIIIFGAGAQRLSARDLLAGILQAREAVRDHLNETAPSRTGRFGERLGDKLAEHWPGE